MTLSTSYDILAVYFFSTFKKLDGCTDTSKDALQYFGGASQEISCR